MPSYNFQCEGCDAARQVLVDYARSRALELICVTCGGTMRVAPVLSVRPGKFAATPVEAGAATTSSACGHDYACRCKAIRLTKPNPLLARPRTE
ncbi:hypothetical protein [Roseixanthobacter glucoisosaccharinicivorans]|uniref:hypothetical protein n=1 Tax=Roseixanthobacter glucoisosaccharinicivorans TaxID=3119923 RepID=UPI003726D0A2